MPINPNISLQVQQSEGVDFMGTMGRAMSLAEMAQNNQARRQMMAQQEEAARIENENRIAAQQEQRAIREALAEGGAQDWTGSISKLRSLGTPTAMKYAADLETAIGNKRKADADAEFKELEIVGKRAGLFGQIAGTINDENTFAVGIRQARRMGLIDDQQAAEYLSKDWSPELQQEIAQMAAQSLTVAQQAEERRKAIEAQRSAEMHPLNVQKATADASLATATAAGQAPIQPAEQARIAQGQAQLAETKRHNAILEARGGDKERLVQVAGPNGEAVWVRESEAVGRPAAQAARSITGKERTDLAFYNRAKDAIGTLEAADASGKSLEERIGASYGSQVRLKIPVNVLQSEEGQMYNQAQRAFTEARLRKESGAAIPTHEYENDAKTYFVQPGDSKAVIEQKRKKRQTVLQGLAYGAGRAYEEYYGEPLPKPADEKRGGAKADPLGIR